jgi:hypothetical protein
LDLVQAVEGGPERARGPAEREGLSSVRGGDAGPVLDSKAKAQYRRRLEDLQGELEEAERFNDPERAARARAEIDALVEQLAVGVGLGGRDRKASSQSERARISVTKAVKDSLKKIADNEGLLGGHLRTSLRTGTYCSYSPDPTAPINWTTS